MQENNPYAAPSSNLGGQDSYGEQSEGVTQGVVRELTGTRGWTQFLGILAFLGAALVIILAVIGQRYVDQMLRALHLGVDPTGVSAFIMIVAVVGAAIAIAYGIFLTSFSSAVSKLEQTGSGHDLANALNRQRVYWVFSGIMSIITLLFTLLGMFRNF